MQCKAAENLRQSLKTAALEDGKKRELMTAIHAHFREWLQGTPLPPLNVLSLSFCDAVLVLIV